MRKDYSCGVVYLLAVFISFAVVPAGCAKGTGPNNTTCQNGTVIACNCEGGLTGTQPCVNGMLTTCQCGTAGSSGSGTATSTAGVTGAGGGSAVTGAGGSTKTGVPAAGASGASTTPGGAGQTAGAGGAIVIGGTSKCTSPLSCIENPWLATFGITAKFCGDESKADALMGILPPSCTTVDDCKALGLTTNCMANPILGGNVCLALCTP